MTDLITMQLGDKFASVHPAEVENYALGGWIAVGEPDPPAAQLFAVYRVKDGEQSTRASKAGLTIEEAELYVAERAEKEYVIEADS